MVKKLIVEVRLNEAADKAANPHIPYTPEEIAESALACAQAGAAAVHFHARNADGSESNDTELYRRAIGAIRAQSDVIIHTTLAMFQETDAEKRLAHIARLVADEGLRPDIAPLDMGSNNIDFWDPAAKRFTAEGFIYANPSANLRLMAERLKGWGVKPQASLWNIAQARLMGAFAQAGLLETPVYAVCYLTDGHLLAGHPPTAAGLRAFVDNMPDVGVEWSVLGYGNDLLERVPEIVTLGGHVSIGLGDYPYPKLGCPPNAELVRQVAAIARAHGRELATPAEARVMLGL